MSFFGLSLGSGLGVVRPWNRVCRSEVLTLFCGSDTLKQYRRTCLIKSTFDNKGGKMSSFLISNVSDLLEGCHLGSLSLSRS